MIKSDTIQNSDGTITVRVKGTQNSRQTLEFRRDLVSNHVVVLIPVLVLLRCWGQLKNRLWRFWQLISLRIRVCPQRDLLLLMEPLGRKHLLIQQSTSANSFQLSPSFSYYHSHGPRRVLSLSFESRIPLLLSDVPWPVGPDRVSLC